MWQPAIMMTTILAEREDQGWFNFLDREQFNEQRMQTCKFKF